MDEEATSQPDDAVLWPLVQVLGDIARRVERDEQAESTDSDSDEDDAETAA